MKAHLTKRLVCLILAIVLCLSAAVIPALAANDTKNVKVKVQKVSNDTVPTELNPERQAAAVQTQSAEGPVRVSIVVKGGSVLDKYSTNGLTANYAAANYRQQVRASQNAVAREISADVLGGKKLDVVWNLTLAANIISANVESDQIDAIRALPDVEAVVVEQRYYPDRSAEKLATQPNMATSSSMIGTNVAYETGYTGAGTRIAVIDTGIDTDHQSFDNGAFDYALQQEANGNENYIKSLDLLDQSKVTAVLSQLNIAQNGVSADDLYYGSKLPFAYNYVDKNTDVTHDNDTQSEHGSHVAGIAAANKYVPQTDGDETTYVSALDTVKTQGVAPEAQLLVMKVFGTNGGAYDSDYMAAIEDAIVLGADSINLSLGSIPARRSTRPIWTRIPIRFRSIRQFWTALRPRTLWCPSLPVTPATGRKMPMPAPMATMPAAARGCCMTMTSAWTWSARPARSPMHLPSRRLTTSATPANIWRLTARSSSTWKRPVKRPAMS